MAKRMVLIIDDEVSFAEMVKLNLEDTEDYEVRTEYKGADGVKTAMEFDPDLILLDIMLPDKDGFDVLKDLKENEKTKSIPIIMLTALKSDPVKFKAATLYAEEFMVKPVTVRMLVEKIEEVLDRRIVEKMKKDKPKKIN
ncbi:MAG: response regulator [bacterium]|nr:response regulator [bacterium]MDD5757223.1 response regulator [bacterium]